MSVDMDKRSTVRNLCNWGVTFTLPNSNGEILLEAKKSTTINNGELVTLCDNQNVMFYGTDNGNHARILIDNNELRKHVGFDSEDGKTLQFVLTDEECKKIFELKTKTSFEKNVKDKVKLAHEKDIIMEYAKKTKLNDYDRIEFLEGYTGLKFRK